MWGGLGGREMAGRLAIARPGGAWVLEIHACGRWGHRTRRREQSAPELTERVTQAPAPGTPAGLTGPLARLEHLSNPARGTSFLLIEKVSMGGHFYRTDREDSSI